MPSPPKPWERGGESTAASAATSTAALSSSPALPDRPSTLSATTTPSSSLVAGTTPSTTALAGTSTGAYGSPYSSGYGGLGSTYGGLGSSYGSYGSYSSPYSRMGMGMGSYGGGYGGYSGYGGYGGYGGGYGGMGMGMGGMGMGMGMGMGGMPGQPGDISLTQRMESGTQATFELISSIVGAFGGFAQMLESTFMATHSSFFAMVGVADQFAHLRNYLGQVLSIFALARYLKNLFLRVTGRSPAIDLDPREFGEFAAKNSGAITGGVNGRSSARPSKRPLVVFFLAVVGLPYLMGKLVRLITARQEEERLRLEQQGLLPPNSQNMTPQQQQEYVRHQQMLQQQQAANGTAAVNPQTNEPLDPSKLTFVRAMYAYQASDPLELSLKSNDIVAVLSKVDPATGQESQWWKGRTRDGRIGWFPSTYVESLESAKERASKLTTGSTSASTIAETTKQVDRSAAVAAAPQKSIPKPTTAAATR